MIHQLKRLFERRVCRLNPVEHLTHELQEKNAELETTRADLRRTREQVVVREKLAALGEITTGVVHEIKNPLNFVKNFSEVSEELLTELQEIIRECGEQLPEERRTLIQGISQDLTNNVKRIQSHTERANRIVYSMLRMGRGALERQPTDVNNLLEEYAQLAYHSAWVSDPDFQIDLKQDFDPEIGEIEVVSQDLGRVFLNMVSNACESIDEKRSAALPATKSVQPADGEPEGDAEPSAPYTPALWLTTRRKEKTVEIRIRDNGNGIPEDVIEKIFKPFFTTKPTDRGTGLGLAMSSEIVRNHGGTIRVESEPGQFTEMIIELPINPPQPTMEPVADEPTAPAPDAS